MAAPTRIPGDLNVAGSLTCAQFSAPAGSIDNADIAAGAAGNYIGAQKVQHQIVLDYVQAGGADIAAATGYLTILHGATARITSIKAVLLDVIPSGDKTATIDLQRSTAGGAFATVLSSTFTLDSTNVIRTPEAGTINASLDNIVTGDVLQVVVTIGGSTGTAPRGLLVTVVVDEKDPE